jgi:hypothetical protein
MAGYLAIATNQTGVLRGLSATFIYGGTLLVLSIWMSGGVRQFKEKYLPLLSE